MSRFKTHTAKLLYPSIEHATVFSPQDGIPFSQATIGTTNPDPGYNIKRSDTARVNVFEYVLCGEGSVFVNGKWYDVGEGDCYILVSGDAHEYCSDPKNPMKKIWINYHADYIPTLLSAYGIKSGVYHCGNVHYHFNKLIEISESEVYSNDTNYLIAESVHSIIHEIARSVTADLDDESGIRRALAARVYGKLNLDELASSLHISKSQVIRSFKKTEGCTPYEYFLTIKINTAKALLKDTKMQVREIAEKLSICDEHYFSALFHSRVGMTPREYRKKKS